MEKIRGFFEKYLYFNETNGYGIAKIDCDYNSVIIVGTIPFLTGKLEYEFTGNYEMHPTYGEQFVVFEYHKSTLKSPVGLITYFSSESFSGIGEVTATKIVNHLGIDAIDKILSNKEVLLSKEIGLSRIAMERFYRVLSENRLNDHIFVQLYSYGISFKMAMKLYNKYQSKTLEVIINNPYKLIKDLEGIGFARADEIATKIGVAKNDPKRVRAGIVYTLEMQASRKGDIYIPFEELIEKVQEILLIDENIKKIIEELVIDGTLITADDNIYLSYMYNIECKIAKHLRSSEYDIYDENHLYTLINRIEKRKNITYTDEQKISIVRSVCSSFSIITGGPGTGKTTIIDGIIELIKLIDNKPRDKEWDEEILLAAPTGRAAKRMKEVLQFPASTIHRALGYNYEGQFTHDANNPLPYKTIIIDETSMIDVYLANRLFEAIKETSRVIFVGDVDQLPSIGPGQILYDMIESKALNVTKLEIIHRQSVGSKIIDFAKKVNTASVDEQDFLERGDCFFLFRKEDEVNNIILKQIVAAINKGWSIIEDIQVLIPIYKGKCGIDDVNNYIQSALIKDKEIFAKYGDCKYYIGDKVIQLVNDPKRNVMNGDIGVITDIRTDTKNNTLVKVKFESNVIEYQRSDLEDISLAYAISIHKSQGSEYKFVIMPIIRNYLHMLKRELIYTGITRAKVLLSVIGDPRLIKYSANNLTERRKTTLKTRIISVNQ